MANSVATDQMLLVCSVASSEFLLNDISTLVGHFVLSLKESEKMVQELKDERQ